MTPPDLSLVIETTTGEISGRCDVAARLRAWIAAAQEAAPRQVEILVVSPEPLGGLGTIGALLVGIHVPGGRYYALKNAGAAAARGSIVLFTDADCRPGPGCLTRVLDWFESNAGAPCLAGRTFYDRDDALGRVNTVLSFGDLHDPGADESRLMPLAHNVALRREWCAGPPFGPFRGRVGGDRYLADSIRERGGHVRLVRSVVVFHEDISTSLAGTVERHLREHFRAFRYGDLRRRYSLGYVLLSAAVLKTVARLGRLVLFGRHIPLRAADYAVGAALVTAYWALDLLCVAAVLLVPPLRRRWDHFQFGIPPA